jgi:hypothetical protein
LDSVGDQLNALAKKHGALAEKLEKSNLTTPFTDFLTSSRASLDACQTHIKDLKAKVCAWICRNHLCLCTPELNF